MPVNIEARGNLKAFSEDRRGALERGARRAADRMAERAKQAFREDIRRSGLGEAIANAWRANTYPAGGRPSLSPAAFVYSRAPLIVAAFSPPEKSIVARNGVYLAIPTDNVPVRGGRKASAAEVERQFGRLFYKRKNANVVLAFAPADRAGGEARLMFVLVRQVHLRPRLDYPTLVNELASEWRTMMGSEVSAALDR